jgi:hypothetical protein
MLRHATGYKLAKDGQDYPGDPALLGASQYSAYDALYGIGAGSFQGFLEGLIRQQAKITCTFLSVKVIHFCGMIL